MDASELEALISQCLQDFYKRRLQKLQTLRLKQVLRRKNPYLFKALGTEKPWEIVERILADYISASDETIFGDAFFEPIALVVSGESVSHGAGEDIVVESDNRILAIAVKSGPNIFNSSQKLRQSDEFAAIRKRLYKAHKSFDALLGHGYGRRWAEPTGERNYRERSGEAFWAEITGDQKFYLKLVRLMREAPALHRGKYLPEWEAAVARFTKEFIEEFCFEDGRIDWEKLVRFVSEDTRSKDSKKAHS
jgi:hypothetical protein